MAYNLEKTYDLEKLAHQTNEIHQRIVCAHQPHEATEVMGVILAPSTPAGPVVELGAYKGGMSAKLALACRLAGRELYVCDTFTGLPTAEKHMDIYGKEKNYTVGSYAGSMEEVKQATDGYAILVPGLFSDTLPTLMIRPAVVFMDVDLISSAQTALRYLWPRLLPGGFWFIHEAGVQTFVEAIAPMVPYVLWGAGYGLGPHAANLAYWAKPQGA